MIRTQSLRRSRHLFTGGVDDAPGKGYSNLIRGDNGAAGVASWAKARDAANNDAAVRAVALDLMVSV